MPKSVTIYMSHSQNLFDQCVFLMKIVITKHIPEKIYTYQDGALQLSTMQKKVQVQTL